MHCPHIRPRARTVSPRGGWSVVRVPAGQGGPAHAAGAGTGAGRAWLVEIREKGVRAADESLRGGTHVQGCGPTALLPGLLSEARGRGWTMGPPPVALMPCLRPWPLADGQEPFELRPTEGSPWRPFFSTARPGSGISTPDAAVRLGGRPRGGHLPSPAGRPRRPEAVRTLGGR